MNIEDAENARQGTAPADGREWLGLAPVACVGVVFLTVLTAAVLLPMADWSWLAGLEKWQGLIGALVTLLAAIIGALVLLHTVRKQIEAPQALARQDRERKKQARRAILAIDLSHLSTYTKECVRVVTAIRLSEARKTMRPHPPIPVLPDRVIDSLKELLEYLEGTDVNAVASLLHTYQVQNARLKNYLRTPRIGSDLDQSIDAVELYSRISALYPYARRESDNIPDGPDIGTIHASTVHLHQDAHYVILNRDSIETQVQSRIEATRRA